MHHLRRTGARAGFPLPGCQAFVCIHLRRPASRRLSLGDAMRSVLAAARRGRALLAAGRRHESSLAVQQTLVVDGTPDSPFLAYSRPVPEPFNDSAILESFPETKARPRMCLAWIQRRSPLLPHTLQIVCR